MCVCVCVGRERVREKEREFARERERKRKRERERERGGGILSVWLYNVTLTSEAIKQDLFKLFHPTFSLKRVLSDIKVKKRY